MGTLSQSLMLRCSCIAAQGCVCQHVVVRMALYISDPELDICLSAGGRPLRGPPLSSPPLSGPPLSGPSLSGPPLSGPPLSGPPLRCAACCCADPTFKRVEALLQPCALKVPSLFGARQIKHLNVSFKGEKRAPKTRLSSPAHCADLLRRDSTSQPTRTERQQLTTHPTKPASQPNGPNHFSVSFEAEKRVPKTLLVVVCACVYAQ